MVIKGKWQRNKQETMALVCFSTKYRRRTTCLSDKRRYRKPLREMIRQVLQDVTIHEWLSDELRKKYWSRCLMLKVLHLQR